MELTKDYIEEQRDCIERCQQGKDNWRRSMAVRNRHKILKQFIGNAKLVLSVGSAGLEPLEIHASHAIDVHALAGEYLKNAGWKGEFWIGSCDNIPFSDKFFEVAVCQEVIEHLPSLLDVAKTFSELDRVAGKWIVTTPIKKGTEPGHKREFNRDLLYSCTAGLDCDIYQKGGYWFVHN